eukprot:COSAG03_NODE_8365_length_809_cov_5.438028_2_plen_24_part_01
MQLDQLLAAVTARCGGRLLAEKCT